MLNWETLLSSVRRKDLVGKGDAMGVGAGREEQERDFDRILFSAPTRRLADKTQVFPMEANDSVRTRLTHSYEVSNLARSIGTKLAFDYADRVFGPDHEKLAVKRSVPALLAAVGLAHDLGNPPFGHQGEASMQRWFLAEKVRDEVDIDDDFLEFDGNAQTFRLVTRLQVLNDDFGLNLTVGTLAALIKYPIVYGRDKQGYKKAGVFLAESDIAKQVWELSGLKEGVRHPLTIVMEACDDIAYSVIDAEDTVKKECASFNDLMDFIESYAEDRISNEIVDWSRSKNKEIKSAGLSSKELNDVSMQMFRSIAISRMIQSVTESFVQNVDRLLSGAPDPGFELIKESDCKIFCKAVKEFDKRYGFQHRDVLKLELQGHNYIQAVMSLLWDAISSKDGEHSSPFSKFAYGSISENYRRVYEASSKTIRDRRQLVCDAVSGMTESYLIKFYSELEALKKC